MISRQTKNPVRQKGKQIERQKEGTDRKQDRQKDGGWLWTGTKTKDRPIEKRTHTDTIVKNLEGKEESRFFGGLQEEALVLSPSLREEEALSL